MSRPARDLRVSVADHPLGRSEIEEGDPRRSPVVVLIGAMATEVEIVRAARRAGAVTLIAPNVQTARAWLRGVDPATRRTGTTAARNLIPPDGLVVNLESQHATWQGIALPLTALDLRLLATFAGRRGKIWSFADLSRRVWGSSHHGDRSMVRSAVQRLREKLRSAGVGLRIISVH